MPNIYDQHRAAFANVSAYVVMHGGERVATIALKFPRDGAGRLYAYVHWIGVPMVRGYAGGYGYDKRSAAAYSAAEQMPDLDIASRGYSDGTPYHDAAEIALYGAFRDALKTDNGWEFDRRLREAGFTLFQAV